MSKCSYRRLKIMFVLFMFLLCSTNALGETFDIKNLESPPSEHTITQGCGELGDCLSNQTICDNKCGCDGAAAVLFYNETLDECVVDVKRLLFSLSERSNTQEKIREEVEKVFKGIIFSAILFMTCATLCVFTACIYCFRINYTDARLKSDVDALASKLKRECRYRKTEKKPTQEQQASESCNVVVPGAGVFVV